MKLSGWSGIPYGSVFHGDFAGHSSVSEIHSDGAVDKAFLQPGDQFIRKIEDQRVQNFLLTGLPPQPAWEKHDDGSWTFEHQRLSVVKGQVNLSSWIMENGSKVTHHILAPYRWDTGAVKIRQSTEGFYITDLT